MLTESRFNRWNNYPRLLTNAEIADPMQVIDDVFDYAHLPDLRNGLWEWLKATISGNFNKGSLHYKDRESMLALYERMQKLLEAAHLLLIARNLTNARLPAQKSETYLSASYEPDITPATELQPIVERLVELLTPDFVFRYAKVAEESNAPVYYFIVVLTGTANRTYAEYQEMVETACTESGTVQLLALKTVDLQKHLTEGHLLFSRRCTVPYLLYQKAEATLPKPNLTVLSKLAEAAEKTFDQVLQKARDFYEGAVFYLNKCNYSLSVFMLQQAAEQVLRGFLQALTQRNCISHDLLVLRKQALPLYPELTQLLPIHKEKDHDPLYRLGKAYVQARYQIDYTMPVTEINELKGWVEALLTHMKPALQWHTHALLQLP